MSEILFFFFSSYSIKMRKKCISFVQLVLLSLYVFFWHSCEFYHSLPSKNEQTVSVSQIMCHKINSSPSDLHKLTLVATLTVTEWQFHSTLNAFHTWIVRAPSHFVCILFPMLCLSYLAIKVSKGLVGLLWRKFIRTSDQLNVRFGRTVQL